MVAASNEIVFYRQWLPYHVIQEPTRYFSEDLNIVSPTEPVPLIINL